MKSIKTWVALGALVSAPAAFATSLTPASTATAAPISYSSAGLAAQISGTLTAGTFTGDYVEYVIYDADNIYNGQCGTADCLTFILGVSNNTGSRNGIEHVSNGDGGPPFSSLTPGQGFQYYSLNVGYDAAGTAAQPTSVDESLYGTVEFNFPGGDAIAPGTSTDYLVVETNASNFAAGNFSAIDSSTSTVEGFVPAAATPEPSSLLLLGTGLVGAAGTLLRRRRTLTVL